MTCTRFSLDLQVPAPISSPPFVEDPITTQVRVFDNRFVESLLELEGMKSVAHKMKEVKGRHDVFDSMEAESTKAELPKYVVLILFVDDLPKINARITFVELDVPPLIREDLRAIEHRKSVVYFNRRFKELSDMVDDMKAVLLGALDYEHVIQEFVGSASERLAKAF
ncbi:hypothetical protein MRB53_034649 [Persea americana]|uniref:Uncharacterized protein n=1 Tax=Persea americana TaxID=3435 RepID=A0ACC2K2Q0_PERAE|nr:hypothetical protein MRB53_034649 [Persea americana]